MLKSTTRGSVYTRLLAAATLLLFSIASHSQTVYCSIKRKYAYSAPDGQQIPEEYVVTLDTTDNTAVFSRQDGSKTGVMGGNSTGRLLFAMKPTAKSIVFISHYTDALGYFEITQELAFRGYTKSISGSVTALMSGTCRK